MTPPVLSPPSIELRDPLSKSFSAKRVQNRLFDVRIELVELDVDFGKDGVLAGREQKPSESAGSLLGSLGTPSLSPRSSEPPKAVGVRTLWAGWTLRTGGTLRTHGTLRPV